MARGLSEHPISHRASPTPDVWESRVKERDRNRDLIAIRQTFFCERRINLASQGLDDSSTESVGGLNNGGPFPGSETLIVKVLGCRFRSICTVPLSPLGFECWMALVISSFTTSPSGTAMSVEIMSGSASTTSDHARSAKFLEQRAFSMAIAA
jgi:hypothetical protein